MATYSHSQLTTFEQCPLKYKFQYIDRLETNHPTTIEAFMGHIVHRALYKLYRDLQHQKLNDLEDILCHYADLWERHYTDDILAAEGEYGPEDFKRMGMKYLSDYYSHYFPFNDMRVIDLETQELIDLPDGNKYHVRIDKLGCIGDTYYVCDYKTNLKMKSQQEADADRQLAMYSIWVRDKFPDAKRVVLKWHMLAFDKEIVSERSREQLDALVDETIKRISDLEGCCNFPPRLSNLCRYCTYRPHCPPLKHEAGLALKAAAEFKKDDGVRMVDDYVSLISQRSEIDSRLKVLEAEMATFARRFGYSCIYGSNKKVTVKEIKKVVLSGDIDQLIKALKEKGLYEEFSHLNYPKLSASILSGNVDAQIKGMAKVEPAYRFYISSRINNA